MASPGSYTLRELGAPNKLFVKPEEQRVFSVERKTNDTGAAKSMYKDGEHFKRSLCSERLANRRVLYEPQEPFAFDLNEGFGQQREKDCKNEGLKLLLEALVENKLVPKPQINSQFVCQRGLLRKIAARPYDSFGRQDKRIDVVAQKHRGVIYMSEKYDDQKEDDQKVENQKQKEEEEKNKYIGCKFESYVTAKPGEKPDIEERLDLNKGFYSVVSTKLGSHSLIYSGEIDCAWPHTNSYIELKTCGKDSDSSSTKNSQLMKCWLQCYLMGIKDVLYGYHVKKESCSDEELRNLNVEVSREGWKNDLVVKSCKLNMVADMQKKATGWKASVCLAFLDEFLTFVENRVSDNSVVHVSVEHPSNEVVKIVIVKGAESALLPDWFVEKDKPQTPEKK